MTTIKINKYGKVWLDSFKEVLDISKVVFYSLKLDKDKSIILKFYDKNKKRIKFYE